MNVLEQIAEQVGKSEAQKRAAMEAMGRLQELTLTGSREDPPPLVERSLSTTTDFVFFVVNGQGSSAQDFTHMRKTLRAYAETGSITVVTTGRMGVEIEAAKLAKAIDARHIEVGCIWQRPNGDGSTVRVPSARNVRNKTLRELAEQAVAAGQKVGVLVYGVEQSNDAVEGLLVKAGARTRPTSKLYVAPVKVEEAPATTTVMESPEATS